MGLRQPLLRPGPGGEPDQVAQDPIRLRPDQLPFATGQPGPPRAAHRAYWLLLGVRDRIHSPAPSSPPCGGTCSRSPGGSSKPPAAFASPSPPPAPRRCCSAASPAASTQQGHSQKGQCPAKKPATLQTPTPHRQADQRHHRRIDAHARSQSSPAGMSGSKRLGKSDTSSKMGSTSCCSFRPETTTSSTENAEEPGFTQPLHGAEEQDYPALGPTRHQAHRAAGSAHGVDLPLRRHLPQGGQGGGPRPPHCNTAAMSLRLAKTAAAVAPNAHAVLLLDQAGWHMSNKLEVPPNITLIPLPPRCPELSPVENTWQFIRDNWLLSRVSSAITTSSTTAVAPGTASSSNPRLSCLLDCAIGHTGSDQRDLV